MSQILPKISIFEEVNEKFEKCKIGDEKKFLRKNFKSGFP